MRGRVEICSRRHRCCFLALSGSVLVSQVVYRIGFGCFERGVLSGFAIGDLEMRLQRLTFRRANR